MYVCKYVLVKNTEIAENSINSPGMCHDQCRLLLPAVLNPCPPSLSWA